MQRRSLISLAIPAAAAALSGCGTSPADAAPPQGFAAFLAGVRREARQKGISESTLNRALTGLAPNQRVIELDRRQSTGARMTWETYRTRHLTTDRINAGIVAYREVRPLLDSISNRYRVSPRVIMGIWGNETNYGTFQGGMNVIEALATLAWEGRRGAYFRSELMAALKIVDEGHITPDRMKGSWAGALGQPQFMPSNFFRLAVDFDGDGRRDIWNSRADALASIANYLSRSGWQDGETWGREVRLPSGFSTSGQGRDNRRPVSTWARAGVRQADGRELPDSGIPAGLLVPDGTGQAFLVYQNFNVIRRYNASDYYALAVGMLGDLAVGA